MECGVNIDIQDALHETPLMYTIKYNRISLFYKVQSLGAAVEARNKKGETLLHMATRVGNLELVMYLL
jgi:ankyrin repeat protein